MDHNLKAGDEERCRRHQRLASTELRVVAAYYGTRSDAAWVAARKTVEAFIARLEEQARCAEREGNGMDRDWSRYQQTKQRVHMQRAIGELKAMLEYDYNSTEAFEKLEAGVQAFITWLEEQSPIA